MARPPIPYKRQFSIDRIKIFNIEHDGEKAKAVLYEGSEDGVECLLCCLESWKNTQDDLKLKKKELFNAFPKTLTVTPRNMWRDMVDNKNPSYDKTTQASFDSAIRDFINLHSNNICCIPVSMPIRTCMNRLMGSLMSRPSPLMT